MKKTIKVLSYLVLVLVTLSIGRHSILVQAEETEIDFWYANSGAIGENNEELTELFNETVGKEKGIKVNAEFQGSYSDLESKLTASFVAGEAPEVAVMEISSTEVFAESGIIDSLDGLYSEEEMSDFYEGLLQNSYINDQLLAIPYLRSTPIFYYNKTLFEKAGIDTDSLSEVSYEDLIEISDKLKEIDVNGFCFNSFAWNYNPQKSFDFETDSLEGEVGKVFETETLVNLADYFKKGVENHNFRFFSGTDASEDREIAVLNQTAAIWQGSTGSLQNYLQIAEENGFELGTMPTPEVNGYKSVNSGGANLVMMSDLEDSEKEAVFEFIKFLTAPDQIITSHINTGYLTTRKSLEEDERVKEFHDEYPAYQTAQSQVDYAFGASMNKNYYEAVMNIMDAFEEVLLSDVDPVETFEPAVKEAENLLK